MQTIRRRKAADSVWSTENTIHEWMNLKQINPLKISLSSSSKKYHNKNSILDLKDNHAI